LSVSVCTCKLHGLLGCSVVLCGRWLSDVVKSTKHEVHHYTKFTGHLYFLLPTL